MTLEGVGGWGSFVKASQTSQGWCGGIANCHETERLKKINKNDTIFASYTLQKLDNSWGGNHYVDDFICDKSLLKISPWRWFARVFFSPQISREIMLLLLNLRAWKHFGNASTTYDFAAVHPLLATLAV